jgi:UDP-glucose 4-epimerase
VLRYFNVYGNRQPDKGIYAPVTAIFARQKKNGEMLTVVGDGTQRRDFVNVLDVVDANFKAATMEITKEFIATVFNIGTGVNYSILEVAKWISSEIKFIPERPGEMMETLANNSKAREFLGWNPRFNLEEFVRFAS